MLTRIPIFILGCYYGKKVYECQKIYRREILFSIIAIILKIITLQTNLSMFYQRLISFAFSYAICLGIILFFKHIRCRDLRWNIPGWG